MAVFPKIISQTKITKSVSLSNKNSTPTLYMSSGFNLPVRRVTDSGKGSSTDIPFGGTNNTPNINNNSSAADPSRYSILGEPLPESFTNDLGPALGISIAAIIASAAIRTEQQETAAASAHQKDVFGHYGSSYTDTVVSEKLQASTSYKKPFQLPIRKVNEAGKGDGGVDISSQWAVLH